MRDWVMEILVAVPVVVWENSIRPTVSFIGNPKKVAFLFVVMPVANAVIRLHIVFLLDVLSHTRCTGRGQGEVSP